MFYERCFDVQLTCFDVQWTLLWSSAQKRSHDDENMRLRSKMYMCDKCFSFDFDDTRNKIIMKFNFVTCYHVNKSNVYTKCCRNLYIYNSHWMKMLALWTHLKSINMLITLISCDIINYTLMSSRETFFHI
jgi:hypothetical protein